MNKKDPSAATDDREFAQQIAQTLEHSLGELDSATLAQLRDARQNAINYSNQENSPGISPAASQKRSSARSRAVVPPSWRNRPLLGGLAMAASVAALLVIPLTNHAPDSALTDRDAWENNLSYLQEDPQMLLDMEMLLAIGES